MRSPRLSFIVRVCAQDGSGVISAPRTRTRDEAKGNIATYSYFVDCGENAGDNDVVVYDGPTRFSIGDLVTDCEDARPR
jgi:hypothetical protein